ncbi:DUF559 domain-containing protein [Oerskovia flava]|uniref:DUF559 domain-containing protein n=1 Tax=Oerskovia flava TaxID=2986422 RepID=UPI00223F176A|nr:DUF559 domain-containing protein [Oerskovia sp. JB1-3-2]
MARPAPPPDHRLPPGPFTTAHALSAGVSRHHLRTRTFAAPFTGVRTLATTTADLPARCRALATVLDESVVFSRTTALRLLGVEVPWRLEDDDRLHVVTRTASDRPERTGVVAHRSRQRFLDVVETDGLTVTSPAQTFVHVAVGLRSPDDVVVLGDAMMQRRRPLTTPAELADLSRRTVKVKGIVQVRSVLGQLRPGTDSTMETRARLALVGAGLPCPEVNGVVLDPDGRYVKRVDLLYRDLRIAIEYDGDHHRTDQQQWRDDVRRRRRLEELGWTVVVVVADDIVRDPAPFLARVRRALHQTRAGGMVV